MKAEERSQVRYGSYYTSHTAQTSKQAISWRGCATRSAYENPREVRGVVLEAVLGALGILRIPASELGAAFRRARDRSPRAAYIVPSPEPLEHSPAGRSSPPRTRHRRRPRIFVPWAIVRRPTCRRRSKAAPDMPHGSFLDTHGDPVGVVSRRPADNALTGTHAPPLRPQRPLLVCTILLPTRLPPSV